MFGLCLAFDIDDTLYLEREYVRSGFEHVGRWAKKELGIEKFAERSWSLFVAGHRGKIFDEVLKESGVRSRPFVVERLVALYRSHPAEIRLLPDALACLQAVRNRALLVVISDGACEAQQNKVRALELEHWFDLILLTEKFGERCRKPSPILFRWVQEQFQLRPDRCCYVADNPLKDFVAPRGLGWKTIRIRRQGGLYSTVEASNTFGADHELPDLSRLPGLLKGTRPLKARKFVVPSL